MIIATPNGKHLSVLIDKTKGAYKIQFNSGGELPTELSGVFTSSKFAHKAIDIYLARKETNGKQSRKKV